MQIGMNPKFMILHREGSIFAGQLTGVSTPIPLQEIDIILLSLFIKESDPKEVALRFIEHPIIKRLFPSVPENSTNERIQLFIQNGLLTDVELKKTSADSIAKMPNLIGGTKELPTEGSFRITTNFALSPCEEGFRVWSSLNREYFIFSVELVLILFLFLKNKSLKEILLSRPPFIENQVFENSIFWLIKNRFILAKKITIAPASTNKTRNAIEDKNSPDEFNVVTWELLKKDTRIPIYFVPHMENHYPLALGLLFSAIEHDENGALLKSFQLIPLTYLSPEEFINGPYRKFGKGIWLFSNYIWSIDSNLQISEFVKKHARDNLTIHGGPSTPNYEKKCLEFFTDNSSIDIAVHGEGECTITEILRCIDKSENSDALMVNAGLLEKIAGITYRLDSTSAKTVSRTNDRTRLKFPDSIPSPYLKEYFTTYSKNIEAAIIETNRGCPFGCTFCDWGSATNQKIRKYDLERVKAEIEWIAKHSVKVLWIADANFGLYDRDIEISAFIVKMKIKYQYPQEVVVNYTKNTTLKLSEIIKIFTKGGIISQGIISIQTTDKYTLEVINRKNIKIDKYDELTGIFKDLNLPLSTDLMLGLPGITTKTFKNDLQRYFDFDVSIKAYPTQLLPNSPMADPEYIEKYQIKVDKDDFLISTFSYSPEELDGMKRLYQIFTITDGYSLLRYVLRYLQWEFNIKAIDFLWTLMEEIQIHPFAYPRIVFVTKYFESDKLIPGGWKDFYNEISEFIFEHYGIERDPILDMVLRINEAAMPDESCEYPITLDLANDFENYFHDNSKIVTGDFQKLQQYPPAKITFDDPFGMANIDSRYLQYDSHQYFWEINSPLSRASSPPSIS